LRVKLREVTSCSKMREGKTSGEAEPCADISGVITLEATKKLRDELSVFESSSPKSSEYIIFE